MKLFKNSGDPDYPNEKTVTTKDLMVCIWICLLIGSGIVAVYSLIWTAWHTFQNAMTLLVSSGIFLALTVAFFPEEDK